MHNVSLKYLEFEITSNTNIFLFLSTLQILYLKTTFLRRLKCFHLV